MTFQVTIMATILNIVALFFNDKLIDFVYGFIGSHFEFELF